MTQASLTIPLFPGENCCLRYLLVGDEAVRLGRYLAKVLMLDYQETSHAMEAGGVDVIVFSAGEQKFPDEVSVIRDRRFPLLCVEEETQTRAYLRARAPGECNGIPVLRLLVVLGVRRKIFSGRRIALLHGALLPFPESPAKDCAVIFGRSGMGKSTAAGRWRKSGAGVFADDALLLLENGAGELWGRPQPTWSRYPDCKVPVEECFPVRGIFRLQRGKDDRIVCAANPCSWRLELVNAMMYHLFTAEFQPEKVQPMVRSTLDFAAELQKKWGAYDILGDLQGDLFARVFEFTNKAS